MQSVLRLVALSTLLATSAATTAATTAKRDGCSVLTESFPTKVFYPATDVYKYENAEFWSNTELLDPACIFRPSSAQDVSDGIKIIDETAEKFAIRGGGHMGIKGANNIDDGILMVMSNLTHMSVSADKKTLSVGPGYRFGDVYPFLQNYGLTVGGARLGPVGVPGLLLAGGVNFYGNQFGFSADQVTRYEVVLADGKIVEATKKTNADLFWALKGGSSNFGIVTRFDMNTIPSKKVWAGIYTVAEEYLPQFLEATANYSSAITDPLSHIVPAVIPAPSGSDFSHVPAVGAVILFYDSDTVTYPKCFEAFTSIPNIGNTLDFKTMSEFTTETGTAVVPHINDVFVGGTVVGKTYDQLLQGVRIINDTFFDALPALYAVVPPSAISVIQLDWQPIGSLWMAASAANGVGGNALGLDPKKGVYLAYAEVVEWFGSEHDAAVQEWVISTTYAINNATQSAGLYDSFNYMGDAAGFQAVYPGYGAKNEAKLLSISRKYDPERLFQTLMPGGFKIGA
ncbi:hypothetical protein O988_00289 [Pseudogymnoascus sp. VKM F-3808]|nr:hypothetical protein O988_00289 [Pseudogymnoascus sp. VKM F-3808]